MTVDYDIKSGIGVIAAFSPSGQIKPIYFQAIENEEQIPIQVTVKKTHERAFQTEYDCVYMRGDFEKNVQLIYVHREHLWMLGKTGA